MISAKALIKLDNLFPEPDQNVNLYQEMVS